MNRRKRLSAGFKHLNWGRQIDAIVHQLSRLAIVCDIKLGRPGLAERILKNDESVCGRDNPRVFQQMRQHLMALITLEERAIDRLGPDDTKEIVDQAWAAIIAIRKAGSAGHSLPDGQL